MPGTVKVKVLSARNLPVMDRASFLTDAFVEICIGTITYKTDVIWRSLNPSWNSDWFCFELDDQALQEEALLLKVMDHDTYSAHDTIGRVYFDLNPLLSRGQTRCLNGWFPIYDTMHGIRGEISLAIRVDVFLDASRYRQSSLGVRFFHSCTVPQGYIVEFFIGFVQELVMNDDPEHQWIEKIRTSRASNEARQRLFSRLSGELQRKMGLKVLNLGGNSVIGYQLHFDLEGETGVVVRGIGTAIRLKKISPILTPPNSPVIIQKSSRTSWESPPDHSDSPTLMETEHITKLGTQSGQKVSTNVIQPLELGEFPFLTISQPLPGMILHFGSVVASKSVKLLDKNIPASTQIRDTWWLELRTEIVSHMCSVGCNAVLAYREECSIYEDVCILSSYGTAIILNPKWDHKSSLFCNKSCLSNQCAINLHKTNEKIINPTYSENLTPDDQTTFGRLDSINSNSITTDTIFSHPTCSTTTTTINNNNNITSVFLPITDGNNNNNTSFIPDQFPGNLNSSHISQTNNFVSDCQICHLPNPSETNKNRTTFPVTSSLCAICKAAYVPDLLFSSADFPPELLITGNPTLIQARICRSKKDTKSEVAASELSELLPFIDYELHYRLMQKLRLHGMNALFGLKFRIAIGDYMIAAIATGTGVYVTALPPPPPLRVLQSIQPTGSNEDYYVRMRLQKQVDEYLLKSRQLHGIPTPDSSTILLSNESSIVDQKLKVSASPIAHSIQQQQSNNINTNSNMTNITSTIQTESHNSKSCIMITPNQNKPFSDYIDLGRNNVDVKLINKQNSIDLTTNRISSLKDTVFMETREPEPEELIVLLRDHFQPAGLILTTTESIPSVKECLYLTNSSSFSKESTKSFYNPAYVNILNHKLLNFDNGWFKWNSFVRFHEAELTNPDSFFETLNSTSNQLVEQNTNLSKSIINPNVNNLLSGGIGNNSIKNSIYLSSLNGSNTGINNSTSSMNTNYDHINNNNNLKLNLQTNLSNSNNLLLQSNSGLKSKQQNDYFLNYLYGNYLGKILSEFNQLTWFRFRHQIPCLLNALDYRLIFTDDEHIQIVATGMILVPQIDDKQQPPEGNILSQQSNVNITERQTKEIDENCEKMIQTNLNLSKSVTREENLSNLKSFFRFSGLKKTEINRSANSESSPPPQQPSLQQQSFCSDNIINNKQPSGCLLTPLSFVPNGNVEAYLGNLDFFFVRETTDLREDGGICGFLHTSLAEVQAVVGAHTVSLGGNALLSYHLSEVVVLKPTSRNQAQCLLNVCGDMARIGPKKSIK